MALLFASVYVMIRALDNIGAGLKGTEAGKSWDSALSQAPWRINTSTLSAPISATTCPIYSRLRAIERSHPRGVAFWETAVH